MTVIRRLLPSEIAQICEIDRSEHVTTLYRIEACQLLSKTVDFRIPGWTDEEGDHSYGQIIEHAQRMIDLGGTAFGGFNEGRLAGIAVYRPRLTDVLGELALLHVNRADRRQGLAHRLLREVERLALMDGATGLYVSATPSGSAIGFYRRHGFEPTAHPHPELLAREPEDIHMTKPLSPKRS